MKIWITGNCGFLGSHLQNRLSERHEVFGNDDLSGGDINNLLDMDKSIDIPTGLIEKSDLKGYDTLVHCSCYPHEGLSVFSPFEIGSSVYTDSMAIFSAAISVGVKRIVYLSSMARYGFQFGPLFEEYEARPVDPYGIAKVAVERTLKVLAKVHGFQYCIVVPHNIIGINQRHYDPFRNVASIMINRMKQGKQPIIYGDGLQKRCFSPVVDVLDSLEQLVLGDYSGIWNVGPDDDPITILELAKTIHEIGQPDMPFEPIFVPDRPMEARFAYCSSNKIRERLGYKRIQPLAVCLRQMWDHIDPQPFRYHLPIEIVNDKTPKTWTEQMI